MDDAASNIWQALGQGVQHEPGAAATGGGHGPGPPGRGGAQIEHSIDVAFRQTKTARLYAHLPGR